MTKRYFLRVLGHATFLQKYICIIQGHQTGSIHRAHPCKSTANDQSTIDRRPIQDPKSQIANQTTSPHVGEQLLAADEINAKRTKLEVNLNNDRNRE